jgi:hypothetical protein
MFDPDVQQARQFQRAKQNAAMEDLQDQSKLRQLLSTAGTNDPAELSKQAYGQGLYKAGREFSKEAASQAQAQQKAAYDKARTQEIHGKLAQSEVNFAYADPSDANMTKLLQLRGIPPEQIPAALSQLPPDAQGRQTFLQNIALSVQDRMPKPTNINGTIVDLRDPKNLGRTIPSQTPFEYQVGPDGVVSMKPGVLAAKREIAQAGANVGGVPMTIVQTDQGPMQVPTKGGGAAQPIIDAQTGKPVQAPEKPEKAPTEGQSNAGLYGARAAESDKILRDLEGKYSVPGLSTAQGAANIPLVGGVAGTAANYALKPTQQMADQAQRNFINAMLRRESGASISPTEFENARKQYFPQPGDSPEVLAQKSANRKTSIEGLRNAAGPAAKQIPTYAASSGSSSSASGKATALAGEVVHEDAKGNRAVQRNGQWVEVQ